MLYNHVLPPNGPSCWSGEAPDCGIFTSTSLHSACVNVTMADGSVQTISDRIDLAAWREMGSRAGGP